LLFIFLLFSAACGVSSFRRAPEIKGAETARFIVFGIYIYKKDPLWHIFKTCLLSRSWQIHFDLPAL
jgi:hypothetical protein